MSFPLCGHCDIVGGTNLDSKQGFGDTVMGKSLGLDFGSECAYVPSGGSLGTASKIQYPRGETWAKDPPGALEEQRTCRDFPTAR